MIVYIVLFAITCGVAYIAKSKLESDRVYLSQTQDGRDNYITRGQFGNMMIIAGIFFLLFGVSAARIAIGHDYWEYTSVFNLLDQERYVSTEIGFNLLVKFVYALFTFEKRYIIVFAIVAFATIYFFMKGLFDQADNFFLGFLLFMSFGYYLSSFNNIRYYLVLSIAFYSVKYLLKKDYLRFAIIIILASFFHMAVLFVLLAYPLALIRWKKWMIPVVAVFVASLIFLPNVYRRLIFIFYPYYENSIFDTGETSYVNIARCAGILIFALIFYKSALKNNRKNMFYFNLNLFALIVYSCCSFIPVISRVGFLLNISQIILVPAVVQTIEKKWLKNTLTVLIVLAGIGYFALVLHQCKDDATRIVPYINWITN